MLTVPLHLFLSFLFFVFAPSVAQDQRSGSWGAAAGVYAAELPPVADSQCALCQRVTVGAYDVQLPPQPTDASRASEWIKLSYIGAVVRATLFGGDDCTTHKDGAMLNAGTIGDGKLRFGPGHANLPPAGAIQSLDYLFTGAVRDSGSGYEATIVIQTAISRETVASTSFSLPYGFSIDDLTAKSNAAAAAVGPLDKTLAHYETAKRDKENTVAIGEKGTPGHRKRSASRRAIMP
jgi:hypothetical protein